MGENSAIEWTGDTWNVVTGCTKVSPACANCYIERTIPFRTKGRKFVKGHIPLEFHRNRLSVPLKKRAPTVYFVNSMSDLFHEDVAAEFIGKVFEVMAQARRHTFQVLTKRPARMLDVLRSLAPGHTAQDGSGWPLPNVWLGVSVENQHFADERIPLLLRTPAAVRFLSCEPLLGPLDVRFNDEFPSADGGCYEDARHGLHWVIAGGESGPKVRPSHPDWFRSLRDQCVAANVPFFFKQWGGRTPKSGGRLLDGVEWNQMPAVAFA